MIVVILFANQTKAQQRIGFIFLDSINNAMQRQLGVAASIKQYEQKLTEQLNLISQRFVDETGSIHGTDGMWTKHDLSKEDSLLKERQEEIRSFSFKAQKMLREKVLELTKPIVDSIVNATKKIARARGYDYVMNMSNQNILTFNKADDLTVAVKELLNVH